MYTLCRYKLLCLVFAPYIKVSLSNQSIKRIPVPSCRILCDGFASVMIFILLAFHVTYNRTSYCVINCELIVSICFSI